MIYAHISQKETLMTPPQLTGVTASVALRAPHRRVLFFLRVHFGLRYGMLEKAAGGLKNSCIPRRSMV